MARGKLIAIAALVLTAAAGFYFLWRAEAAPPIVGVVRTTEIRVAPEVGGQLVTIKVEPGARVRVGDVVAELSAVELTASVGQARAQLAAAKASRDNVYAGVRAEQVASLAAEIAKAKARLDYTQAQLTRVSTLASNDFAAQQALDQAENDVASAPSPTPRSRLRPPRWRCSSAASTRPRCARPLTASSVSSSPRSVRMSAPASRCS
jgi:multidrug resistance efflux pump